MVQLNEVGPPPIGVVIDGVVVIGLGVFYWVGVPFLGFAMLPAPTLQGCPLASRMSTGCLMVGFVVYHLQSRTLLGLVL